MSIIDSIYTILKGANPDAPDEDIHAQALQLSQHPDAASVMQSVSPSTSAPTTPEKDMTMDKSPIGMPSAPPMPPSSFDVPVSDNTVTQNGSTPGMAAPAPSPVLPPEPENPETPPASPVAAPSPVAAKPSTPSEPVAKPALPALPTDSNDKAVRDAGMADALKGRKTANILGLGAGASDAINNGLHAFGMNAPTDQQAKLLDRAKANFEESKGLLEEKISNDPNSDASRTARDLVLQIAPQMAQDPNFAKMSDKMLRDKLPLVDTMMKAKAAEDNRKLGLEQVKGSKDLSLSLRQDQQQDKLEQNAKQMVSNLRGDKSLARAEEQRDGAIVAYNRLKEIKASGKEPNPVDYVDVLGQIYKARTGNAPGEQIMKDIRQSTAQGSFGKAFTYVTGQQAPATSRDIANSLMDMAKSMGNQADKFHDGYMKAHLIKPHGLDDERWQPILTTGRGTSFADATKSTETPTTKAPHNPLGLDL